MQAVFRPQFRFNSGFALRRAVQARQTTSRLPFPETGFPFTRPFRNSAYGQSPGPFPKQPADYSPTARCSEPMPHGLLRYPFLPAGCPKQEAFPPDAFPGWEPHCESAPVPFLFPFFPFRTAISDCPVRDRTDWDCFREK